MILYLSYISDSPKQNSYFLTKGTDNVFFQLELIWVTNLYKIKEVDKYEPINDNIIKRNDL